MLRTWPTRSSDATGRRDDRPLRSLIHLLAR
jgi:hypothetical protein